MSEESRKGLFHPFGFTAGATRTLTIGCGGTRSSHSVHGSTAHTFASHTRAPLHTEDFPAVGNASFPSGTIATLQ